MPGCTHGTDAKHEGKADKRPSTSKMRCKKMTTSARVQDAQKRCLPEMGALPRAPKKAPAWRTETTLEEMVTSLLLLTEPLGLMMPKCSSK